MTNQKPLTWMERNEGWVLPIGCLSITAILITVIIAVVATRAMRGLLYNVEPSDPTALLGAAVVLAIVAGAASWIPARRAAKVDPVEALRAE